MYGGVDFGLVDGYDVGVLWVYYFKLVGVDYGFGWIVEVV